MIAAGKKLRVLVVDDSMFMRVAVARTLSQDPRIEVVGQARDGRDAVDQARALRPDAITMDFNMPRMNGAEAVREIMKENPVPVVMLSAHTYDGAKETVEALSAGAVDFVTKPDGEVSADLSAIRAELVQKLVNAANAHPQRLAPPPPRRAAPAVTPSRGLDRARPSGEADDDVSERRSFERISFVSMVLDPAVIIAISTGGPAALEQVIPFLPEDLPHAVLVVQHMPASFTKALAERLSSMSAVRVREARAHERMVRGTVLIAPGDNHVVFERNGMIKLTAGPPVNGCRPSADVTLQSAVPVYGGRLTAVVMTGMGRDGALGAAAVRAAGGRVIAQDRETSVVYGMPRAVVEMNVVDEVVPLGRIASRIAKLPSA